MESKKFFDNQKKESYLVFRFNQGKLSISFVGISYKNFLLSSKNNNLVDSLKEALNCQEFSKFKVKKNVLIFENLEFKILKDKVYVSLIENKIQDVYPVNQQIYNSNQNDKFLWSIINSDEDFGVLQNLKEIFVESEEV